MARWIVSVAAVVMVTAVSVGQTPNAKAPVGTWVREIGEGTLRFTIEDKALQVSLAQGDNKTVIDADIGISKEGTLFGRVSKTDPEDIEGAPIGTLFSFRYEVDGNKMIISELQGTDSDEARQIIQGEYSLQPKEK